MWKRVCLQARLPFSLSLSPVLVKPVSQSVAKGDHAPGSPLLLSSLLPFAERERVRRTEEEEEEEEAERIHELSHQQCDHHGRLQRAIASVGWPSSSSASTSLSPKEKQKHRLTADGHGRDHVMVVVLWQRWRRWRRQLQSRAKHRDGSEGACCC